MKSRISSDCSNRFNESKSGAGKTTTAVNYGISIATHGRKLFLVDAGAQGSLLDLLAYLKPDNLPVPLATTITKPMMDKSYNGR